MELAWAYSLQQYPHGTSVVRVHKEDRVLGGGHGTKRYDDTPMGLQWGCHGTVVFPSTFYGTSMGLLLDHTGLP